jgi:hypothetical protein
MRNLLRYVSQIVLFAGLAAPVKAQENTDSLLDRLILPPLNYTVHRTAVAPVIDGMLNDTVWKKVAWTENFNDIEGDIRPKPKFRTRVKMLWDSSYLYLAAELQEPHVWANVAHHDEVVFRDNDFEVFIDPAGMAKQYFEIEINAIATIFDLFLPEPYRNGSGALISWNCDGLKKAVHVNGSLNNPSDIDSGWTVEMAIPIAEISIGNEAQIPYAGAVWRINFSRVEWETNVVGGKYVKRTDSISHHPLPEHNWVWSPQGVINMHFPERWGYLIFSDAPAGVGGQNAGLDIGRVTAFFYSEQLRNRLWEVYYREHIYQQAHNAFTADPIQLPMLADDTLQGNPIHLSLEATTHSFFAVLTNKAIGIAWGIDQLGNIQLMNRTR